MKPGRKLTVPQASPIHITHDSWTIDTQKFRSKSRNCPFDGWEVKGKATTVIVAGEVKKV